VVARACHCHLPLLPSPWFVPTDSQPPMPYSQKNSLAPGLPHPVASCAISITPLLHHHLPPTTCPPLLHHLFPLIYTSSANFAVCTALFGCLYGSHGRAVRAFKAPTAFTAPPAWTAGAVLRYRGHTLSLPTPHTYRPTYRLRLHCPATSNVYRDWAD